MKNKSILLSAVIIIVAILAGIFLISSKAPTDSTSTNPLNGDMTGWKTFSDVALGVTFKYPESIGTTYISLTDWPPAPLLIEGGFVCTNAGEEIARAGETKSQTINGHEYCVTKVTEGAAGSMYTQYAYVRKIQDKFVSFAFSLRFVQCANYEEPQKSACEGERSSFNIDPLIDQIIGTTTLVIKPTEKITYYNASADLITVDLPFPGAVTGKEFSVIGKARGTWFFEASFPIEVLDKNGKSLVQMPAHAEGDWMTENFVPFRADIKIPATYMGPATLILRKDNASGLPEHEASISFPITIEY